MKGLRLHGGAWKKPHPLPLLFTTVMVVIIGASVCMIGETDAGSVRTNFVVERPLLEVLKGILKERNLIHKRDFVAGNDKKIKAVRAKKETVTGSSGSSSNLRSYLLRDELNKETQDNCLAKILCGAAPAKPAAPANPDYALLVKEFFDFFGSDEPDEKEAPKKVLDDEKDDDEDEEDTAGRSGNADLVNITGSVDLSASGSSTQNSIFLLPLVPDSSSAEVITTTSTSATITTETTGASLTPLTSIGNEILQEAAGTKKVTLEEIVGELRLTPEEFLRLRTARGMRLSQREKRQSSYVRRKLREMRMAKSNSKKLKIAGEIASSMRSPRQCRDFDKVASEVLSTCPLTSEVVRYFNSNLQNGTQIALVKNTINGTDAGLVLLGDSNGRPQTYFVDNHAANANTKITNDLKNPTVSDRYSSQYYQIYEDAFPGVQDVSKVSLTNQVKKEQKKKVGEEEDSEEDDEDDEEEGDAEDDDDEGSNDEAQEQNDNDEPKDEEEKDGEVQKEEDGDGQEDEASDESIELFRSPQTRKRKVSKKNKNSKRKKQVRPPKTTPAPIQLINVYGVPQPSFNHEFSQISGQIGSGPVILFDQDDYDSHLPNLGPPIRAPRPRPTRGKTTLRSHHKHLTYSSPQKGHKIIQKNKPSVSHPVNHGYKTLRPKSPPLSSPSRTDDQVLQSAGQNNDLNSRYRNHNQRPQGSSPGSGHGQPPSYFTQSFGQTPATRPGEYYRNGLPPMSRPVAPSYNYRNDGRPPQMGMNYYENSVRGRFNFAPNNPGAGLIRPPASMAPAPYPNFRFYG